MKIQLTSVDDIFSGEEGGLGAQVVVAQRGSYALRRGRWAVMLRLMRGGVDATFSGCDVLGTGKGVAIVKIKR